MTAGASQTEGARPRVVIFARDPVAGRVKTRLAAAIGAQAALDFYLAALTRLVDRLTADSRWRTILAVTPDDALEAPGLAGLTIDRIAQGDGDLGQRMGRRLAEATPEAPVLIVGSDVPELEAGHVQAALEALASHDLVLGPSPDGGYWLIGARGPPPVTLLAHVRWSSPHALADTLAGAAGLSVGLLASLEDVDDEDSWRRYLTRAGR